MSTDLLLGSGLLAFGVYSIVARVFFPGQLGKLEPMKKMWGENAGLLVHIIAYTVLPLVAGGIMVFNALVRRSP